MSCPFFLTNQQILCILPVSILHRLQNELNGTYYHRLFTPGLSKANNDQLGEQSQNLPNWCFQQVHFALNGFTAANWEKNKTTNWVQCPHGPVPASWNTKTSLMSSCQMVCVVANSENARNLMSPNYDICYWIVFDSCYLHPRLEATGCSHHFKMPIKLSTITFDASATSRLLTRIRRKHENPLEEEQQNLQTHYH